METLWIIPVHVRPVVSIEGLEKGRLETPNSGLDRFNLTDVGEAFLDQFRTKGAEFKIKGVESPFPWEIVFKTNGQPVASLRGVIVGSSTFRSAFKLVFDNGPETSTIIGSALKELGRELLESPYWDDENWQIFMKMLKLTREEVESNNGKVLESIGLKAPYRARSR
ncbi:MAG: hypothetical protein ACMUIE_05770 [Thermoplasmatota archaeon]